MCKWLARYAVATVVLVPMAAAASFLDQFVDPLDGRFDGSTWLIDNRGFLPVPIVITEPAVGAGLGAAAVFFHDAGPTEPQPKATADDRLLPPSLSALFGAATENGTWLAGGAHRGVWQDDHVRYLGAMARTSLNLSFYGADGEEVNGDSGLNFNGDGWYLLQEIMFRIPGSDFFLGGRFDYLSMDIGFDEGDQASGLPPAELGENQTAGLGLLAAYDSRDNMFTPSRGILAEVHAMFHDGSWLGDFTFQRYRASALLYWEPHPKWVLGWRLDGQFARGEPPFYALPYIDLRGIPALRYQGENVLVTEVEARWRLRGRWALVGFAGVGSAEDPPGELFGSGEGELRHTYGAGARYLIARRLGMQAGIDVARGPEETAVYLQLGSAWR